MFRFIGQPTATDISGTRGLVMHGCGLALTIRLQHPTLPLIQLRLISATAIAAAAFLLSGMRNVS